MPAPPSKNVDAQVKRQARVVWATIGCGFVACALASVYLYKAYASPYEYVKPGTRPYSKAEIAGHKQDEIAHARRLREKWRPWAEAHQDLLRKMYRNKGDEATLQEFIAAVPGDVISDGSQAKSTDAMQITSDDIGAIKFGMRPIDPEQLRERMLHMASWMPFGVKGYKQIKWTTKEGKPAPPPSDEGEQFVLRNWRQTFSETGEVQLVSFSHHGLPNIYLWASGRITMLQNVSGDKGGHLDTAENNPQVEPPYEFLR